MVRHKPLYCRRKYRNLRLPIYRISEPHRNVKSNDFRSEKNEDNNDFRAVFCHRQNIYTTTTLHQISSVPDNRYNFLSITVRLLQIGSNRLSDTKHMRHAAGDGSASKQSVLWCLPVPVECFICANTAFISACPSKY